MELITQKIRQCIEKVKDMSQVGFDRDYVIKDNKPDVSKVVCQNGQVKLDERKFLKAMSRRKISAETEWSI